MFQAVDSIIQAEELGLEASEGGSSGNDQYENNDPDSTSTPSIPDDEFEVELPSGDTVTYGELKKGYTRTADYHVKTREAADMKRQADEQTAEAAAVKAEAVNEIQRSTDIREAMAKDVLWYNTHDKSAWAGYTPEVDRVMGAEMPSTPAAPASAGGQPGQDPRDQRIAELEKQVSAIADGQTKTENERKVDAILNNVSDTAGSEGHELTTPKLLLNAVQAHQAANNGELPSEQRVTQLSKEIHDDLVNAGIPIPVGTVPASASTKANVATGGQTPKLAPAHNDLNMRTQRGDVTEALGNYLRELQSAKG